MFFLSPEGRIPETACRYRNKLIWVLTAFCHSSAFVIKCEPIPEWTVGWCDSSNRPTLLVDPNADFHELRFILITMIGVAHKNFAITDNRDVRPRGNFKELSGPMLPEALLRIYRVTTN